MVRYNRIPFWVLALIGVNLGFGIGDVVRFFTVFPTLGRILVAVFNFLMAYLLFVVWSTDRTANNGG